MSRVREDRFTGCLLGVAVGDALGQPIEAFPPERLRAEIGEIRDFMPGDPRLPIALGAGQWTDDTQITGVALRHLRAYNGAGAIPRRWRAGVERGDEIEALGRELWQRVFS